MAVSDNIKLARENKGLSYSELSNLTGIPKSTLQRYETREKIKIPIDSIEKIAKGLNINPISLVEWDKNFKNK